jgi:putative ABC transport system permease protein
MRFLLEIKEGLLIAWDAIRANKLRSALTTLGIVIGIVTVTSMATAIDALNRAVHDSLSILGSDVLFVGKIDWLIHTEEDWIQQNKRADVTLEQVHKVEKQMLLAGAVAPTVSSRHAVWYKNRRANRVSIVGTTDQFLTTSGFNIAVGRFMTAAEIEGGRPVCVIGNDVATNLFQRESPLRKKVKIGERQLEVIGVLEKRGSFLGLDSFDNQVILPVSQFVFSYWTMPRRNCAACCAKSAASTRRTRITLPSTSRNNSSPPLTGSRAPSRPSGWSSRACRCSSAALAL